MAGTVDALTACEAARILAQAARRASHTVEKKAATVRAWRRAATTRWEKNPSSDTAAEMWQAKCLEEALESLVQCATVNIVNAPRVIASAGNAQRTIKQMRGQRTRVYRQEVLK